jgi:hypothetical protein
MKRKLLALAIASLLAAPTVTRARTRDVAFSFRMGAGFPGDVNRTHPASILPGLMNTTNPVRLYGDPVLVDPTTNSYRGFIATDTAVVRLDGVLVRPFPTQQTTGGMSSALGAATPPVSGVIDVLDDGFVMVRCNNFATQQPTKGGAVFVRTAVTAGALIQGGFTSVDDGVNAVQVTNAKWNGPADANGIAEMQIWASN